MVWKERVSDRTRQWIKALMILTAQGLVRGPDGLELHDLCAYALRQGWQVSTERTRKQLPKRRWHATVSNRQVADEVLSGTHGYGITEDEALAIAVAGMVRQHARLGDSRDDRSAGAAAGIVNARPRRIVVPDLGRSSERDAAHVLDQTGVVVAVVAAPVDSYDRHTLQHAIVARVLAEEWGETILAGVAFGPKWGGNAIGFT
jgi:hypothetical protein